MNHEKRKAPAEHANVGIGERQPRISESNLTLVDSQPAIAQAYALH